MIKLYLYVKPLILWKALNTKSSLGINIISIIIMIDVNVNDFILLFMFLFIKKCIKGNSSSMLQLKLGNDLPDISVIRMLFP